jgi:hypothetical protein
MTIRENYNFLASYFLEHSVGSLVNDRAWEYAGILSGRGFVVPVYPRRASLQFAESPSLGIFRTSCGQLPVSAAHLASEGDECRVCGE